MTYQESWQRGTAIQLILAGLLVFGLVFVWPIQYTIALRNGLLGALLLLMAWGVWRNRAGGFRSYGDLVGVSGTALLLLTGWIVIQAALISPFPEKAFQEITGQWFKSLACFMLGTLVVGMGAINRTHEHRPVWLWLVTLVLGLQVALTVADGFYLYAQTGAFQMGVVRLMGHKALASYVCNTLFAVLAADILGRIFYKKRLLPMPLVGVLGLIGLGLICTWMIQARNGLIGLGSLLLSCLVVVWLERRTQAKAGKLVLILALIAGLFIAFAWGNYKTDPRWQKFEESAALGWQLDASHAWMKPSVHPYPRMSNGEQVDVSAYERTAWVKSGLILALQHPLGLGYDRSSYGRARALHYGPDAQEGVGDHSHSSMIDLAIGIGIPGLLLWMAFLMALMVAGWRAFNRSQNAEGLVLIFLVTGFFGRSLIDSNIRDHMLEQFMFLAALMLAEIRRPNMHEYARQSIMTADISKILIIRGANIGDLLCTTPLFTTLRKHFPAARIDALVNSYNAPVVINNPDLDHVFYYTKAKHRDTGESVLQVHWRRLRLLYQLRRQRYDVIILANCGYLHRPLRLAKLIGARRVIGFVPDDQRDNVITDRVPYGDVHAHEVIKIHRLLAPLGIHDAPPALTLMPDASALRHAENARDVAFPQPDQRPILAMHISARLPSQRWPAASFIQLIRRLHSTWQGRFMLFWSPGDEDNPHHPGDDRKANEIIAACAGIPLLPYPTQHLQDLIAGLSICQGMFCADGGAMHVGAAVGLPIACLFGDSPVNNWFPWGVPHIVLQPDSRNVADITPEQAFDACLALLPEGAKPV